MSDAPKPGIYPGIPFATYQAWEAVNPSFLTRLSTKTPYHAWYDKHHPKPETDELRVGRALHSYLLEPATFDQFWMVLDEDPPRRPSERQRNAKSPSEATMKAVAFWDAVAESGKGIVKAAEMEMIQSAVADIRRQQCTTMVAGGQAEVCIVWEDPQTGLLCKSRLDYHRTFAEDWNHYICDVKSSRDIDPLWFSNDVAKFGYALAAAMRIDGWDEAKRAMGEPPEESIYNILAVDKVYHIAWLKQIDDDTIEAGRNHYREALTVTAECMKTGVWPAYESKGWISAPAWYLAQHGVGRDRIIPTAPSDPGYVTAPEPEVDEDIDSYLK